MEAKTKEDKFNFTIPISGFEKGKDPKTGEDVMMVKGVASSMTKDSDGETLEPSGFQFDKLLDYGYLNYNHQAKHDPTALVGEPTKAVVVNKGKDFYIEGKLWSHSKKAQQIYELAEVLEKSGSKRKLAWSIEGTALERDDINPKRIKKALITGIAITPFPKNSNTFLSIMKGEYEEPFVDYDYESETDEIEKGESDHIFDISCDGKRYMMDKGFNIEILEQDSKLSFDEACCIIVKGHELGLVSDEDLEKAKSGIYEDTPENRKLGRVGKKYGSKKETIEDKAGKESVGEITEEKKKEGLKNIYDKYSKLKHDKDVYLVGGGLSSVKYVSRRHESAKDDKGKLTLGEATQLFKKATGLDVTEIKGVLEYAVPNMEWHHAGFLPKQYGGGMKKTYFLNSAELADISKNWDSYREKLNISKSEAKIVLEQRKSLEQRKFDFLQTNAKKIERVRDKPEYFYETAREMNGKYGWFDSTYKSYNLPEYYSGWKFENKEKYDEFMNIK